ncbi:MAG TPA: hypothetical protein VE890_08620 [Thermoguttaceae bacterium]|nr:hypothetical protein [Thermoguttaceae bacterium]
MTPLPYDATDEELIGYVDQWAALLEIENYQLAAQFTDHVPEMKWTSELIQEIIKNCGECRPDQKVTVAGKPTDITQRKEVDRWERNDLDEIGEVWYDLNIDGLASDLTATFRIQDAGNGLILRLNDIHVM